MLNATAGGLCPSTALCKQKGKVKDQVRENRIPSPFEVCLPLPQTHRLGRHDQGAGQSVDDAIESHDIPHDDVADHNCPWGLQRNCSQV